MQHRPRQRAGRCTPELFCRRNPHGKTWPCTHSSKRPRVEWRFFSLTRISEKRVIAVVAGPSKIDGGISRGVKLADGSGRVETWGGLECGWYVGGAGWDEFMESPPARPPRSCARPASPRSTSRSPGPGASQSRQAWRRGGGAGCVACVESCCGRGGSPRRRLGWGIHDEGIRCRR